jgi:hypothetical protein
MPYTRAETIGKTAPRPPRLDPASVGQVPRGEPANTYHVEAFWQAISHQAAARTARYAEASPAFSEERRPHFIPSLCNRKNESALLSRPRSI